MQILHILRTRPDETVEMLIRASTNGDRSKTAELFRDDVVWPHLIDDIFSHDKVISWW